MKVLLDTFVQLGLNEDDSLKSSSILIYMITEQSINTQIGDLMPMKIKKGKRQNLEQKWLKKGWKEVDYWWFLLWIFGMTLKYYSKNIC